MKKVLALVLALTMVLGSFSFVSAATFPDTNAESVAVLSELGVIDGYPDGTFKPANIVTRAEMAKMIVVALGLEDFAVATTSPYSDMWQAQWAQGFVSYATSLGIITGYPDGTFKPNQTVSYNEACAMIVRALGYTADFLPGEWPAEWVVKAKTLGILDGITAATAAGATRGDIAKMLYAALDEQIGYVDRDGVWQVVEDDTMLARLGAKLYDPDTTDEEILPGDAFVVTDDIAEEAVVNIKSYLGAYVTAYANSDNEIIAIKQVKSVFLTGTFDDDFDENEVFSAEKDYDIRNLAYNTLYFKNGAVVNESAVLDDAESFATYDYTIAAKVSGSKIDDIYSVMLWSVDDDFYFEEDDLTDTKLAGHKFMLDDNDEIDLASFELIGADNLEAIEDDSVVYVYLANGTITRIEVGNAVVEGEITRISSDGKTVTIGGKGYKYSVYNVNGEPGLVDEENPLLDVEDEVTLYLDAHGFIYDLEEVSVSATTYAVYINYDESESLRVPDALRLFLPDGTAKWFDVDADEVDFDKFVTTDAAIGAVVKYGVNSDGEINVIEVKGLTSARLDDSKVTNYFDGKSISSEVVIFTFDGMEEDLSNPNKYGVTTLAKIKDSSFDKDELMYLYVSPSIRVMMIYGEGVLTEDVYGIYSSRVRDAASDTGYLVTYWVDGEKVEYEATSSAYVTGVKNELVKLDFNSKSQVTTTSAITTELLAEGDLAASYSSGKIRVDADTVDNEYFIESDAIVYVWDADAKALSVGSTSDLRGLDKYVVLYDTDSTADDVADIVIVTINLPK